MKHLVILLAGLVACSVSSRSQIVILKSNPSDAYAAMVSSTVPSLSGPNPVDLCAAAWTNGGVIGGWRTFFKFNDSALAGMVIDSAILQVWADPSSTLGNTGAPTYGTNNTCVLYRVTNPWANTINWLTMPSYTSLDSVLIPQSTSFTENYLHVNVTSILNDIIGSGYNYGFMFKSKQEVTPYNSMIFYSSSATDSAVRPQILVYGHHTSNLYFAAGHNQSMTICVDEASASVPINSYLAAIDSNTGATDNWSLIVSPSHGAVFALIQLCQLGGRSRRLA